MSSPDLFKEVVHSILISKKDPFDGDYNSYVPYVVNMAVAAHIDGVYPANDMNINPGIPKEYQYKYLLNIMRGYKRQYQPWLKRAKFEDIELVKQYFHVSNAKAKDIIDLLSSENLIHIRKALDKGGIKKQDG